MRILSIDPGITTGVAMYDVEANCLYVTQTTTPDDLIKVIDEFISSTNVVIIENFIGGGYRTAESTYTQKLLGFAEYYTFYVKKAHTVILAPPQNRKAYVAQAGEMLLRNRHALHAIDATAHILAYLAKERIVREPDRESTKVCQM